MSPVVILQVASSGHLWNGFRYLYHSLHGTSMSIIIIVIIIIVNWCCYSTKTAPALDWT